MKFRTRHRKDITDETTSLLQSESSSSLDEELAAAQRQNLLKPLDAPPIGDAFTFQSSVNLLVYCVLALHSVTFDQMLPVFMAYPPEDPARRQLPFKFAGGFGMTSSQVGSFFSLYGGIGMFLQVSFPCLVLFRLGFLIGFPLKIFIFPPITNRLGPLRCLIISSFAFPVIYVLTPFVVILPREVQQYALFTLMMIKSLAGIFAFPCSTILLTNSSPTLRLLGTLNGIAVTLSAMGRAIGPAVSSSDSFSGLSELTRSQAGGLTFSLGQSIGYIILPWWILALTTFLGALPVLLLVEGEGFAGDNSDLEEEENAESNQAPLK